MKHHDHLFVAALATTLSACTGARPSALDTDGVAESASACTAKPRRLRFLALGDSIAYGDNDFIPYTSQARPDDSAFIGYADLVGEDDFGGHFENLACPGETTGSFLDATSPDNGCQAYKANVPNAMHTRYAGAQMAEALEILSENSKIQTISLTIGGNDLFLVQASCVQKNPTDPALIRQCIEETLPKAVTAAKANVATIWQQFRDAGYTGKLVLVTSYSPNLADRLTSGAVSMLDAELAEATYQAGGEVVDGYAAFVNASNGNTNPCTTGLFVANSISPPSAGQPACGVHPSSLGAQVLAKAVTDLLDAPSEKAIVIDLQGGTSLSLSDAHHRRGVELVKLRGKANYFGWDVLVSPPAPHPFSEGVAFAKVWLAEYPFTRDLGIHTDGFGAFSFWIVKPKGQVANISFAFEKDFYSPVVEGLVLGAPLPDDWSVSRVQSNVYTIDSDDVLDVSVQMPDELYLTLAKGQLEQRIGQLIGQPYAIDNLVVATVGKQWASIFDMRLPHGDSGAVVSTTPVLSPLMGPIYFNASVSPDATLQATSVDGGVLFDNVPVGRLMLSATKAPFTYEPVVFNVGAFSQARLLVAAPPHSIQGNNTSEPGAP